MPNGKPLPNNWASGASTSPASGFQTAPLMQKSLPLSSRLLAGAGVLLVFALVWLYTREFRVFTNTLDMRGLLWGACLAGALLGAALLYRLRQRLSPWDLHLPELLTVLIFTVLTMPLLASWLNRAGGKVEHESFVFVSEQPFISSG